MSREDFWVLFEFYLYVTLCFLSPPSFTPFSFFFAKEVQISLHSFLQPDGNFAMLSWWVNNRKEAEITEKNWVWFYVAWQLVRQIQTWTRVRVTEGGVSGWILSGPLCLWSDDSGATSWHLNFGARCGPLAASLGQCWFWESHACWSVSSLPWVQGWGPSSAW